MARASAAPSRRLRFPRSRAPTASPPAHSGETTCGTYVLHKAFGGNVQVVTDHTGFPVWASPVEPGSTHDITAARDHALPALYKAAADGMPTLADKGYQGAGAGVLTPVKGARPCPDDATYNRIQTALRAPAERANAMLKQFKALRHVSLDPSTITSITATALVIIALNHQP